MPGLTSSPLEPVTIGKETAASWGDGRGAPSVSWVCRPSGFGRRPRSGRCCRVARPRWARAGRPAARLKLTAVQVVAGVGLLPPATRAAALAALGWHCPARALQRRLDRRDCPARPAPAPLHARGLPVAGAVAGPGRCRWPAHRSRHPPPAQRVTLTFCAILVVALAAQRAGRPALRFSPTRVLVHYLPVEPRL